MPESAPVEVEVDMEKVNQLVAMGYECYACKRAIHATNDVMAAFEWLLNHENDPDLHTPLYQKSELSGGGGGNANSNSRAKPETANIDLSMITGMGFSEAQAKYALQQTDNNIERAADWIFSHMDEISNITVDMMAEPEPQPEITGPKFVDGNATYKLRAFVSHMGSNANTGHYVAHIRHDLSNDNWVIFNDDKACHSVDPPKKMGYLYFFERR